MGMQCKPYPCVTPSCGNVNRHVGRGGFGTRPYSSAIIPMTPRIVLEKMAGDECPHSRCRVLMYRIAQGLIRYPAGSRHGALVQGEAPEVCAPRVLAPLLRAPSGGWNYWM
ncbi:MAG: hypothetical protein KatS3mg023_4045 [Armatimonadota bacterium]|nr:MAG: hypothetical protein KatS3mg023_4045 [Armatimonadota bacterium]